MRIVVMNIVVGLLLAYGGINEIVMRGILRGETDALIVGIAGTVTSLLLVLSGIALWRNWRGARKLTFTACALVAAFCIVAALPPRYVGMFVLLLGVGYPAIVVAYLSSRGGHTASAT